MVDRAFESAGDGSYRVNEKSKWAILAVLRFFLSVVVVMGHYRLYVQAARHTLFGAGYLNPLSSVYGFFILSGYSIAASLETHPRGFYKRRFVRIWPLYLGAIAFSIFIYIFSPKGFTWPLGEFIPGPDLLATASSLFMLQTILTGPMPTDGPLWSLSGEWWHYMLAPWLRRLPLWGILVLWLASFIVFFQLTPQGPGVAGMAGFIHGKSMAALSWVWLTGFLYYRIRNTPKGFVLLVGPALYALTKEHSTGVPMFITALVLVLCDEVHIGSKLRRVFNFLGDYSYPLYLFHIPAMLGFLALSAGSNPVFSLLAASGLAMAALFFIDYPTQKFFGRRLRPSVSSAVSAAKVVNG